MQTPKFQEKTEDRKSRNFRCGDWRKLCFCHKVFEYSAIDIAFIKRLFWDEFYYTQSAELKGRRY